MSVRQSEDAIILEGRCGVEDAERLLLALQDCPGAVVDAAGVRKLHLAVAQVLLALRPALRAVPDSPIFARNILCPLISDGDNPTRIA